jgi:CPA2 family monovalent cation:H+ antiporter-2
MPHYAPLITTFVAAFVLAFALGAIANRLKLSPIVGYLIAGMAVGPYTPGFVADIGLAKQLAEMGVILLMFGVGLHFSVKDMTAVASISVPGAVVQIATGTALGTAFGVLIGWPLLAGLVFGFTLSVASTVVLLRALDDRKLLRTRRGQIAVGWLIVEDIALIAALVLLPTLAKLLHAPADTVQGGISGIVLSFGLVLIKVSVFVAFMLIAGPRIIPWLLNRIAMTGSRELFTLAVLSIAMGVAFAAAEFAGASFALGAFFAGMVLSGSELSQRAAERSLPLRDAFAVLFFVSVGMLFNPQILIASPLSVLAVVFIIVVGKSSAAFLIVRMFGYPATTAALIAVSLAQIGEFSFILGGLAFSLNIIPKDAYDLLLAGAIISIMLNPLLFRLQERYEAWQFIVAESSATSEAARTDTLHTRGAFDLSGHVIVVGYGRVGRHLSEFLSGANAPFVVIEPQKDRVDLMEQGDVRAIYGKADDPDTLRAAGINRAKALLIAIPNGYDAVPIIAAARALNPGIPIIARAQLEAEVDHLTAHGADDALLAERELASSMVRVLRENGASIDANKFAA